MSSFQNTCLKFFDFFETMKTCRDDHELIRIFDNFLNDNYTAVSFTVLKHLHQPQPFQPEIHSEFTKKILEKLSKTGLAEYKKSADFTATSEYKLFPLRDNNGKVFLIIVFTELSPIDKKDVLFICRKFENILQFKHLQSEFTQTNSDEYYGNLISQVNHDFNSLINIITMNNSQNDVVDRKILYSRKLTADLLFFIREPEFFTTKLPWNEFWESVISGLEIPAGVNLKNTNEIPEVSVTLDAELMNRALSELLMNGWESYENRQGEILITTELRKNISPFIDHDWLELKIKDAGKGISADFLQMAINPLFTTKKNEGHSGLGLALAEKIIRGHNGIMDLQSTENEGTEVAIHLPITVDNNEAQ